MAGPAEFNVVVTGFSPWGSFAPLPNLLINTSWLIANSLPRVIFRSIGPNIRILTYPTPVKTSWETARKTVPTLWQAKKSDYGIYAGPKQSKLFAIDAMIHLGMEDEDNAPFSFEKTAYKTEFEDPDVDDKRPSEDDLDGGGTWGTCPEVLETDLDVDSIYRQVTSQTMDINIKTSTNPGRYLCAYIYYASLANLYNAGETRRAMFVHVPPKNESADIDRGVFVISKLIEAIADHAVSSQHDELKL